MFRYLRFRIFQAVIKPISNYFRSIRMRRFFELIGSINSEVNILDLGGQPQIWDFVPQPLNITIINLPGIAVQHHQTIHNIKYVEGDACRLDGFKDNEFEITFSNSVIEHVGDDHRVRQFASEAKRVGKKVWIQTPSKYFPLEPHTGMLFWWYYPSSFKEVIFKRWQKILPAWTESMRETRFITKDQLVGLFPECHVATERFLGLSKSYIVYSKS